MDNNKPLDAAPDESKANDQKKSYHTPKLQRFGGLAELVQMSPGTGPDGNPTYVDCTSH